MPKSFSLTKIWDCSALATLLFQMFNLSWFTSQLYYTTNKTPNTTRNQQVWEKPIDLPSNNDSEYNLWQIYIYMYMYMWYLVLFVPLQIFNTERIIYISVICQSLQNLQSLCFAISYGWMQKYNQFSTDQTGGNDRQRQRQKRKWVGTNIELKRREICNPINKSRRKKQPQVPKKLEFSEPQTPTTMWYWCSK